MNGLGVWGLVVYGENGEGLVSQENKARRIRKEEWRKRCKWAFLLGRRRAEV